MAHHLKCLLCGVVPGGLGPHFHGKDPLVAMQEHAMEVHGVTQDDLTRVTRREIKRGYSRGYIFILPDGRARYLLPHPCKAGPHQYGCGN